MNSSSRSLLLPSLTAALALTATQAVQAQHDRGRVLSSTPVMQQVAVPQQVCQNVTVREHGHRSGAGAVVGAIAGGAMGNAIGDGHGRAAATAIGLLGGAILGDRIEGRGHGSTRTVQECSTQNVMESRPVGYHVVYEYAGRQYSTQLPQDPGRWVPVSVMPAAVLGQPEPAYRPQAAYAPEVVRIGGWRQHPYWHHGHHPRHPQWSERHDDRGEHWDHRNR